MIEAQLYTSLKDNVALVGGRVYPKLMPQDTQKPALVYGVINDRDIETLGCAVGSSVRFQIDIYAESYSEVKAIKEQVKSALYGFEHKPREMNTLDDYEHETQLYREMIDFTINT